MLVTLSLSATSIVLDIRSLVLLTKDLNLAIGEVIKGYQDQTISTLEFNLTGGGLHNETKEITESYEVPYCYERSADGIWENIRSFFGKKYYSSGVRTETSTKVIALGTNVEAYIEKISPAINDVLSSHIEQNIDNIKDKYFAPQEQFADIMMKKLVFMRRVIKLCILCNKTQSMMGKNMRMFCD